MVGRLVQDLHGHTYELEDYKISGTFPDIFTKNRIRLVANRDTVSQSSFISVEFQDNSHGYIFYSNRVYVYGYMRLLSYSKDNDMRYGKGQ